RSVLSHPRWKTLFGTQLDEKGSMKPDIRFRAKTQRTAKTQSGAALRTLRSFASLRETAIRKSIVAALCFIFLFPLPLIAQRSERRALNESSAKLTAATPESVGMSSERLAKID